MSAKTNLIVIGADGDVRFLHDDDVAEALASLGPRATRRASHVEPEGDTWSVDMTPVGGPKVDGFRRREDALRQEVVWLEERALPKPREERGR